MVFFSCQRRTVRLWVETLTWAWLIPALILLVSGSAINGCNPGDSSEGTCCEGITGNVDADEYDLIDVSDVIMLEEYLYHEGARPDCLVEADVNGSLDRNPVNMEDLTFLVEYIFGSGPEPCECPDP